MRHTHRIIPGHQDGTYCEENTIEVEVSSCDMQTANHIMWHFANWQLYQKKEDRLAWKGLAGFLGREEIIEEMMIIGRLKGKKAREAAVKKLFEDGTHPFLSQELIDRRRPNNSLCMTKWNQSLEGRQKASEAVSKTNSSRVKCPHCDYFNNPGNVGKHIKHCH